MNEIKAETKKWLDLEADRIVKEKNEKSQWVKIQDGEEITITILPADNNNFSRSTNNFGNEVVNIPCVIDGMEKEWSLSPTGKPYQDLINLLRDKITQFKVKRLGSGVETKYYINKM